VAVEEAGGAELMCDEADVGEVFDGLHLEEGIEEGVAEGDGAVIGHEDGGVAGNECSKAVAELVGSGGGVGSERNGAEGHDGFGAERFIESASGACKASGDGGVGVDDGADIGSSIVDC